MGRKKSIGFTRGDPQRTVAEINISDWTRAAHAAILTDRGITLAAVGQQMGVSRQRVHQYLSGQGSRRFEDRFEDAVHVLTESPAPALYWPEGAPKPLWISEEAQDELARRSAITFRDMMRAPGVDF